MYLVQMPWHIPEPIPHIDVPFVKSGYWVVVFFLGICVNQELFFFKGGGFKHYCEFSPWNPKKWWTTHSWRVHFVTWVAKQPDQQIFGRLHWLPFVLKILSRRVLIAWRVCCAQKALDWVVLDGYLVELSDSQLKKTHCKFGTSLSVMNIYQTPKTDSEFTSENGGSWKTNPLPFGMAYFQGRSVHFREGILCPVSIWSTW